MPDPSQYPSSPTSGSSEPAVLALLVSLVLITVVWSMPVTICVQSAWSLQAPDDPLLCRLSSIHGPLWGGEHLPAVGGVQSHGNQKKIF